MSPNRSKSVLAAGVLVVLLGGAVLAQDLETMELFAPADLSLYGSGPKPHEGYFFVFDGLFWSISQPDLIPIGLPNARWQDLVLDPIWTPHRTNSLDTGWLGAERTEGNRIEFGRIVNRHGWLFSTYRLNNQTQMASGSDGSMALFFDGWIVIPDPLDPTQTTRVQSVLPRPLVFQEFFVRNSVETWGVELNYLCRQRPCYNRGIFEWFFGVRYLEFDEEFSTRFSLDPTAPLVPPPDILADSAWRTEAENHIVGPQIGLRWFNKHGRWMLSTEGRFLAGFNSQNVHQDGTLATQTLGQALPQSTSFKHVAHAHEWSPAAELRAELRFQATRAISFRAGWTGIWIDGIARASNVIDYRLPAMGINAEFHRRNVLINGLTIGVDVNR